MPTLAELTADRARVTATYNGVAVQVEYAPGLVTEKALAGMLHLVSGGVSGGDASGGDTMRDVMAFTGNLNGLLARLVSWWDLTDGDGAMIPLDAETLADLPLGFRHAVLAAIFGDLRVDPTTASDSPPASLATIAPSKRTTSRRRA